MNLQWQIRKSKQLNRLICLLAVLPVLVSSFTQTSGYLQFSTVIFSLTLFIMLKRILNYPFNPFDLKGYNNRYFRLSWINGRWSLINEDSIVKGTLVSNTLVNSTLVDSSLVYKHGIEEKMIDGLQGKNSFALGPIIMISISTTDKKDNAIDKNIWLFPDSIHQNSSFDEYIEYGWNHLNCCFNLSRKSTQA